MASPRKRLGKTWPKISKAISQLNKLGSIIDTCAAKIMATPKCLGVIPMIVLHKSTLISGYFGSFVECFQLNSVTFDLMVSNWAQWGCFSKFRYSWTVTYQFHIKVTRRNFFSILFSLSQWKTIQKCLRAIMCR